VIIDRVLDVVKDILTRGKFPCSKAKELGTYLDLPNYRIENFLRENQHIIQQVLLYILEYWLETDQEKSWTKLAEAVKDCGHPCLAETIQQQKYPLFVGGKCIVSTWSIALLLLLLLLLLLFCYTN